MKKSRLSGEIRGICQDFEGVFFAAEFSRFLLEI